MRCCTIKTSLVPSRKSLVTLGNLRQSSENLQKVARNLQKIIVISMFI